MSCILVTGANGFLGRHLVSHLLERGYDVIAGTRQKELLGGIFPKVELLDILRPEDFKNLPSNVDFVVHTAARRLASDKSLGSIRSLFETNALGTLNVLHYALECGIKKVIYCSSLSVYTLPQQLPISEEGQTFPVGSFDSYYGISKLAGELLSEQIRKDTKLQVASLRLGRIYGPGDNVEGLFEEWRKKAEQGKEIIVYGNGDRSLDFLYVRDAIEGIETVIKEEGVNGIMNLSSGVETTWKTLAQTFIDVFSHPKRRSPLNYIAEGNKTRCFLDISKLRKSSGYVPQYSLKDGFLAWKQNLEETIFGCEK